MSDFEIEKMYGVFPGEQDESYEKSFEDSLIEYMEHKTENPFYTGFITKFGKCYQKPENRWLKIFEESLYP